MLVVPSDLVVITTFVDIPRVADRSEFRSAIWST